MKAEKYSQNLFKSTGTLRYGETKLVLDVDQGIVDYYLSLIPKTIRTNRQMYAAHISVVRNESPNMELWRKYDEEQIEFQYSNIVHNGTVYYWLNAWCKRLEEIRRELGLVVDEIYTEPPCGFVKTFHISLGNTKELIRD